VEEAPDSNVLGSCRTAIIGAATALVERAQTAGVVRADTEAIDVIRMVAAIALLPAMETGEQRRLLDLTLDGLRYRPE
jgi:RNase P/RNase MRP subunit POP5